MKKLDQVQMQLLDNLCEMVAININDMYKRSKRHGDLAFKLAHDSFERHLIKKDGEFIHAMHMEWRYFLVGLLKGIEEAFLEDVYRILFFSSKDKPNNCKNCKYFQPYEPKESLMGVYGHMGLCKIDNDTKFETSSDNGCSNNFEYREIK